MAWILITALFIPAIAPDATPPEEKTIALVGARIYAGHGPVYDPGVMVVRDGKIVAVGSADQVKIPDDATKLDVSGKVIIPGLVDTHSHLGLFGPGGGDGNEGSDPVQPILRAIDAINPNESAIRMAHSGGVTTANIMPGSANAIGGQTLYVKLRGRTVDEMRIITKDGVVGGLKMANGENPKRAYGGKSLAPMTRMKIAAMQRAEFQKAVDYRNKWQQYRTKLADWEKKQQGNQPADPKSDENKKAGKDGGSGDKPTAPNLDLALEALVEVLDGKRTVHFHSHRADDIRTTLRLKDEFKFDLVIQHGTEGYRVAKEIAERKVYVSMTIPDSPGGKAEVADFIEACGAEMTKAGVKVMINTDDPVTESRFLLRTAAISVRGGLSEEDALKGLTIYPAQAMHVDHKVGSLETGKDADFVVLSGSPFSVYARVMQTYIDGRKVFELADEHDRRYQQGGHALSNKVPFPGAKPIVDSMFKADDKPVEAKRADLVAGKPTTIKARWLHTGLTTIENGTVRLLNDKITYAGPAADAGPDPEGTITLTANHVSPGMIDAYSLVPLSGMMNSPFDQDADEKTGPIQPELRVLDAFNPHEPLLNFFLQQGVTVIHACPGRANIVAGQTGVFRTSGRTAESMSIRFPQAMLMNLGNSPKAAYAGKRPGTRMASAAMLRQALLEAQDYGEKKKRAKPDAPVEVNLKNEALAKVLDGTLPALVCAHQANDLVTAGRLADEFKLKLMLGLATEGYLLPSGSIKQSTPILLHPTMQRASGEEESNSFLGSASYWRDQKQPFAIISGFESYVPKTRLVRYEAAIAMVHGLGFADAMRAVTIEPAKILGIADKYGSLEVGKVADIVLYNGDPFEYSTHVTHVITEGKLAFDRSTSRQPLERVAVLAAPEGSCCLSW